MPGPANGTLPPTLYKTRFALLDAFRGLCALMVVAHHTGSSRSAWFAVGNVAVIAFFVISGYCIAAAADACQRNGLSFREFMWRRLRRIYPPYALALAFYVVVRLVKWKLEGVNDLARPAHVWIQNITLTQWMSLLVHPRSYPPSNPTLLVAAFWSLCYEEQFYLVFGLALMLSVAFKLRVRAIVGVLMAVSVAWIACFPTICYGVFIEYWAMFAVGSLVFYRLCKLTAWQHRRLVEMVISVLLVGSAALRVWYMPAEDMHSLRAWLDPEVRVAWSDLAVASLFAMLLLTLRPLDEWYSRNLWLSVPLGALGTITYSLYLIHQFNLNLTSKIVGKVFSVAGVTDAPLVVAVGASCLVQIGIASVFWYFCERPFLNKPLAVGVGGRGTDVRSPAVALGMVNGAAGSQGVVTEPSPSRRV